MTEAKGYFRIGDIRVAVVNDGTLWLDGGAIFGLVPRVYWEPIAGPTDDHHRLPVGLNCLLVRAGGVTILVETAVGTKQERLAGDAHSEAGRLLDDLARYGVQPRDVDIVINTHLHYDHCGWNTTYRDGKLVTTFPRARYFVPKGEWEAANHPNERTRGTYLPENLEPLDGSGQLELVEGEREVVPGVRMVPAPGHTADHAVVELVSGGEMGIYLGELAQHPVMLERLAWISSFDVLPLVTLETKKRLLERIVERDALLFGNHYRYPGVGRLRLAAGKRQWEALAEG